MSSCKACHGSHHLVEIFQPCRNRYLVICQDPTVCEECFGCLLQIMFHINMMQFGALCRQYNLTIFDQNHVPKSQSSPEGKCKCSGGCASFVRTTVLLALSVKPTCDSTVAKSCKNETASAYDFANNRMSSAKRRSSSAGWPSPKSNPFKGTSRLQPFIAHCSTAENNRGLRTHPCLTPEVMGKLRLDPHFFFFPRAPFCRSRSVVDCFTGQSPGKAISIPAAPDVHQLETYQLSH